MNNQPTEASRALRRLAAVLLIAAGVSAGALSPVARADATATDYRFGVFYDDKRIGQHDYLVTEDGDATRVSSRADFQVKILFVTAYRYRHQANEVWQNGCLSGLSSVTNDNGERFEVQTELQGPGLRLTRLEPTRSVVRLDQNCPASFAYWDRSRLSRDALINAQTGEIAEGRLTREGTETINGSDAVRYRLEAEGVDPITLWYRADDDVWLQLETRRNGATLQYRLESVEQRQASAIEENPRVENPPGI